MVWQDSKIDGRNKGQGVVALRVGSALNPEGEPFVISQRPLGHQERPSVAVLTGGGAAFTWLGPKHQSPDVFTRFTRADGTFITGDTQVNPLASRLLRTNRTVRMLGYKANRLRNLTFRVQDSARVYRDRNRDASVTALPDGGALVTYSGSRRVHTNWTEIVTVEKYLRGRYYTNDLPQKFSASENWMLDVFFQRFSADGRKVGGEVLVNQLARYNQRAPSVALLPNGTFVVAWVSETFVDNFRNNFTVYAGSPLLLAQVDIVARIFAADGTPLSNEFSVNNVFRTCDTPTVSALADGRFTVAWAQRDGVRTNGWDIYARTFDAEGDPEGDAVRVNSHTYGDQYSPRIESAGLNQLLVWSSLGQDKVGAATGQFIQRDGTVTAINLGRPASVRAVYGRLLSGGAPAGPEFRVNSTLTSKPTQPAVVSDGVNRFVALWSGFSLEGAFDLYRQAYLTPVSAESTNALPPLPGPGPEPEVPGFRVNVAGTAEKVHVNWTGQSGTRYQIQTSTNLVNWINVGEPRTGTGADSVSFPLGGGAGFYRVVKLP